VPYPSFASRSCKYFTREPVKPQDFSSKKCVNVNAIGAGVVYLSLPWADHKVKEKVRQSALAIKESG
jgi:hypothetical protein